MAAYRCYPPVLRIAEQAVVVLISNLKLTVKTTLQRQNRYVLIENNYQVHVYEIARSV